MANDCCSVAFMGLNAGSFYFDAQDEVDTDTFQFSRTSQRLLRCKNNKYLIFNAMDMEFDRRDLSITQQSYSDYKLNVNLYIDDCDGTTRGRAVTLCAVKDDKMYAAVCKNEKEVCAEEVEGLQEVIQETQHKAVFYMFFDEQSKMSKFRSSLYPDKVLGFDKIDSQKLILCTNDCESQEDTIELL